MTELLDKFVENSKHILKDSLCGIYLHGSAVMGCFSPEKSDIDLIVVVDGPLTDGTKRAFLDMTAELNAAAPPKGIEMSVVQRYVCDPFLYPTPFETHFSSGHLKRYRDDPETYIRTMTGTDRDLAAHFTVIRARGKCLVGLPVDEVFGEVPKENYLDALIYDVEGAREEIAECPMYFILNLARVLAYIREGKVLSKKEGGEWALNNLPAEHQALVRSALDEYTRNGAAVYDTERAKAYADYMLGEIPGGLRSS